MGVLYQFYANPFWFVVGFILLNIWIYIWYAQGLWYSGRYRQKMWFALQFILTPPTLGIMSILYLILYRKPRHKVKEPSE